MAMERLEGLIIPGGESTAIGKLAAKYGLLDGVRAFVAAGRPVYGTCAGLIMLADSPQQPKWNQANPKTELYVTAWKEHREKASGPNSRR